MATYRKRKALAEFDPNLTRLPKRRGPDGKRFQVASTSYLLPAPPPAPTPQPQQHLQTLEVHHELEQPHSQSRSHSPSHSPSSPLKSLQSAHQQTSNNPLNDDYDYDHDHDNDCAEDYNYDPLWHVIRQQKAQRYLSVQEQRNQRQQPLDSADMSSRPSTTTTENRAKGNKQWREGYLHPRFIRVQEGLDLHGKPSPEHLRDLQKLSNPLSNVASSPLHLPTSERASVEQDLVGEGTFIEEFTEEILREMREWAAELSNPRANEARWEIDYWQIFFLKSSRQLARKDATQKPVIHRIPQASIAIAHDQAKLTPLIADNAEDRRESGLIINSVFKPNFSGKSQANRIWYPDHQYAITARTFAQGRQTYNLPFFRLVQPKHLPPHLLVEVKADAKPSDWIETQNSLAFLTAYLLHERLLLRFLSQNNSIDKGSCFNVEDIYLHGLSLCGTVAKVWRMYVRDGGDLEGLPIRYDLHLITELDTLDADLARELRVWINAINAHAQAVTYHELERAFNAYSDIHKGKDSARLQDVGFIYVSAGGKGGVRIAARRLENLRRDFRKGIIEPEEALGSTVITFDDKGNAREVPAGPILRGKHLTPSESEGSVAATADTSGGTLVNDDRDGVTKGGRVEGGTSDKDGIGSTDIGAKKVKKILIPTNAKPNAVRKSQRIKTAKQNNLRKM
ncbi:hypothetical protein EJ08DRAFT_654687 [Tothia fuscella]|uniref:Uncharacterized protein n=1 Tax=Tothia fuscella TaxID=1048955 RepID=A0A9P4NEE7_9PEZI|nr:hypothetical protein EJ08DRAFT_654687 [Tothia fuscella]